jgi:hypothetical protein
MPAASLRVPVYVETSQRVGVSNKPAWMDRPEYRPAAGTLGQLEQSTSGKAPPAAAAAAAGTSWSGSLDPDAAVDWSEVVAMVRRVETSAEAACPV